MAKPRQTGFVAYAREDAVLVNRFLALLRPRAKILRRQEVALWWDVQLDVGRPWAAELALRVESADFGLACVTADLVASAYAMNVELPALLCGGRPLLPVLLSQVDTERCDLGPLTGLQIFGYRPPGAARQKAFADCGLINQTRFCDGLVTQLDERLTRDRRATCLQS